MLLAIETSSKTGSVALHDGISIVAHRDFAHGLQNAAKVLPLIDEMCRSIGIGPKDITDVAVSIGPGSFTGLRIGVTLAKTLCFANGAKLLAVPTLPVLASNAPQGIEYVMPILDAKRDQVFAALYRRLEHSLEEISPPQLVYLPELLAHSPRPLLVLGEGIAYHRQHLDPVSGDLKSGIQIAPEDLWPPKAATVARLGLRLKEMGAYADAFKLTPLYIRKPEAQERMEAGLLKHLEQ